ncbi:reverse transcriptase domain-containing protein [Leisingera caerulea]|uniref:reverse transcriptase domain-containing protein n=1 Tax=Leisingera caerulea TaxID=506591 RepID=UPI0021A56EE7|nr:reverse transcriptase domain-containing protein [Leisingera caerulea]UWQ84758.1 hypothetical protein K3726_06030 [Leisingera caerulea]
MHNYEFRFEVAPNKWVFVPTTNCKIFGRALVHELGKIWKPNGLFYHFGRRGGHVSAMKVHVGHSCLASVDLTQFFPSVTRTMVARSLRKLGYPDRKAFNTAMESCVVAGGRKFLPYGFPQSMCLATLVVENSALGSTLKSAAAAGVSVSMFVDDIIISANNDDLVVEFFEKIQVSARDSGFEVSASKVTPPGDEVASFNCRVSDSIELLPQRIERFKEQLQFASDPGKAAILRYVSGLNQQQHDELLAFIA